MRDEKLKSNSSNSYSNVFVSCFEGTKVACVFGEKFLKVSFFFFHTSNPTLAIAFFFFF